VHPKLVGDATEAMAIARLVQAGKNVLLPFGENRRYDLVIDEGDHFVRVQCKTARLRSGAIRFTPAARRITIRTTKAPRRITGDTPAKPISSASMFERTTACI